MADEIKKTEGVIEETTETAEEQVIEETKPSKFKAWCSRHKVGLQRAAKAAALVGGGLVAGVLIANKKKAKDEEQLMLECGEEDWDDYDEPSEEDAEETPEEEDNEG